MKLNILATGLLLGILSFTSRERTSQFANLITNEFDRGYLGNLMVLQTQFKNFQEEDKDNLDFAQNNILSQESIAVAAQLTSSQVEKLRTIATNAGTEVIVPTYIPSGFQLESVFENHLYGYSMIYKDNNNYCFEVWTGFERYSYPSLFEESQVIDSKTFGSVYVSYTELDHRPEGSLISTKVRSSPVFGDGAGWIYYFNSPSGDCKSVSLLEAIQIIQSHEYLFPSLARELQFFSEDQMDEYSE